MVVERLGLAKVGKVLVIGEDLYWEGGAMQIVAPGFQGVDDSEEFTIIDIVVSFGGGEGL